MAMFAENLQRFLRLTKIYIACNAVVIVQDDCAVKTELS